VERWCSVNKPCGLRRSGSSRGPSIGTALIRRAGRARPGARVPSPCQTTPPRPPRTRCCLGSGDPSPRFRHPTASLCTTSSVRSATAVPRDAGEGLLHGGAVATPSGSGIAGWTAGWRDEGWRRSLLSAVFSAPHDAAWVGLPPSAISLRLRSDFALRIPCLSPLSLPQPHRFCISEALAPYLIVHFRSARASLPPLISPSAPRSSPTPASTAHFEPPTDRLPCPEFL